VGPEAQRVARPGPEVWAVPPRAEPEAELE